MATMKVTPDSQLATPDAIQCRIELIKRENGGVLSPAIGRRITALNLRLGAKVLTPAINAALLISKGDEEWGDRKCY